SGANSSAKFRSDASTPSHDFTAAGFVAFVTLIRCRLPDTDAPPPDAAAVNVNANAVAPAPTTADRSLSVTSSWSSENEPVTVNSPANSIEAFPSTCNDNAGPMFNPNGKPL